MRNIFEAIKTIFAYFIFFQRYHQLRLTSFQSIIFQYEFYNTSIFLELCISYCIPCCSYVHANKNHISKRFQVPRWNDWPRALGWHREVEHNDAGLRLELLKHFSRSDHWVVSVPKDNYGPSQLLVGIHAALWYSHCRCDTLAGPVPTRPLEVGRWCYYGVPRTSDAPG